MNAAETDFDLSIKTPDMLGKIFWTETMKSLIQLSGGDFTDSRYYTAGVRNIMSVANAFTAAQWKAHQERTKQRYPHGIPGMWRDIQILCEELTSWSDVRDLFNAGFLTTACIPYIFATLIRQGKASQWDLKIDDMKMFDYTERQMGSFIKLWVPVLAFGSLQDQLEEMPIKAA